MSGASRLNAAPVSDDSATTLGTGTRALSRSGRKRRLRGALPSPALNRPLGVTTTEKRSVERVSDHRVNSWKFNGFIS
jgi:hypothetical protein